MKLIAERFQRKRSLMESYKDLENNVVLILPYNKRHYKTKLKYIHANFINTTLDSELEE